MPFWWLFDRGSKLRFDEPEPCGYAKHEALLIEEARTGGCQGFFHSFRRDGDGRETITTAYLPLEANYSTHMPNEKPRPLGGTGASELALMDRRGWGWGLESPIRLSFQRALKANRSPCGGQFTNGKRLGW